MFSGRIIDTDDKYVCGDLFYNGNAETYIEYSDNKGRRKRAEVFPQSVNKIDANHQKLKST